MTFLLALALTVDPWHGTDLPTATQAAAKYRLTLSGKPKEAVHLTATQVAPGWIAAFCDSRVCSPGQVTTIIPASGKLYLQFELIRETEDATHKSGARIESENGPAVTVPAATR